MKKIKKVKHTIVGQVWCFGESSSYKYQRMDLLFPFGIKEIQEKIRTYSYKEKTHENLRTITIDQVVVLLLAFKCDVNKARNWCFYNIGKKDEMNLWGENTILSTIIITIDQLFFSFPSSSSFLQLWC